MLGVLVGLKEEARIIRRFLPDAPIATSYATSDGAHKAAQRLVHAGATHLLSFGYAGGLSSSVLPGTIIIPDRVIVGKVSYKTDPHLNSRINIDKARTGSILHSSKIIDKVEEKNGLYRKTGCVAVDMESGALASTGLPFSVLRVICDDVNQPLPEAAISGMKNGNIYIKGLVRSLLQDPSQISSLIALGKDVSQAKKSIIDFLEQNPISF
ncbi:hypothetical protein E3D00_09670 [Swingsia samuiensis]|uniref:Nucleoside phosphorylase domain-containing protein n=1 Tax=Swingsia samuiensis TaxID=1293412 RepID=A0A4Y6UMS9_9PROT|nr:hypothetical protein E3D00_09670 [Swingsia samuiensis]